MEGERKKARKTAPMDEENMRMKKKKMLLGKLKEKSRNKFTERNQIIETKEEIVIRVKVFDNKNRKNQGKGEKGKV